MYNDVVLIWNLMFCDDMIFWDKNILSLDFNGKILYLYLINLRKWYVNVCIVICSNLKTSLLIVF